MPLIKVPSHFLHIMPVLVNICDFSLTIMLNAKTLNPFKWNWLSHQYQLNESISNLRVVLVIPFVIVHIRIEHSVGKQRCHVLSGFCTVCLYPIQRTLRVICYILVDDPNLFILYINRWLCLLYFACLCVRACVRACACACVCGFTPVLFLLMSRVGM